MPTSPLSGELSRRRLGTESGALRREARAIARAGGNPQGFLEAAGKAKLQEGSAISSAEQNRAKQEYGVRAQAELARQQVAPSQGGVLRSAAGGTIGTNSTITPPPTPAQVAPSEPLTAMQVLPKPPANQAKADIEQYGIDEAIKRYYQRSAEADKAQQQKLDTAKYAQTVSRGTGVPEVSAPVAIPPSISEQNKSMAQVEPAAPAPAAPASAAPSPVAPAPKAPATPASQRPFLTPTGGEFVGNTPAPAPVRSLKETFREAEAAKQKRNAALKDTVPSWMQGTIAGNVLKALSKEY